MTDLVECFFKGALTILLAITIGGAFVVMARNATEALLLIGIGIAFIGGSVIIGYLIERLPERIEQWK